MRVSHYIFILLVSVENLSVIDAESEENIFNDTNKSQH